jgi:hypothetical protein
VALLQCVDVHSQMQNLVLIVFSRKAVIMQGSNLMTQFTLRGRTMKILKNAGHLFIASFLIVGALINTTPVHAGSYNFSYHSSPSSNQNCRWVYKWKWVYGKRVKVKIKVCN